MGATYKESYGPDSHGPVMKALLQQYTRNASLSTADESQEHPLFPVGRSEARNPRVRPSGAADVHGQNGDAELGQDDPDLALLDSFLRRLDAERFPWIHEQFAAKGGCLAVDDFVAALMGRPGVPFAAGAKGTDERRLVGELRDLHGQLAGEGAKGEEDALETQAARGSTFVTGAEDAEDARPAPAEATVSWGQLAKLLLDENIIGNIVGNFNIFKVLSHMELDKINPRGANRSNAGGDQRQNAGPKALWPQAEALREEFGRYRNAVSLEEFVVIMKSQVKSIFELTALFELVEEERQLVAQLVGLFETIDFGGNNSMSWEDFTNFLVDQGMIEERVKVNAIRFNSKPVRCDTLHTPHCEKAFYLKNWDRIAYVEQGCKSLKLCTPDMAPVQEVSGLPQVPICAEFCADYQSKCMYLAVACSDRTVSFFDVENNLKLARKIEVRTAQLAMCWSEVARVLFTADHEGRILPWDLSIVKAGAPERPEKQARSNDVLMAHLSQADEYQDYLKGGQVMPQMRHSDEPDEARSRSAWTGGEVRASVDSAEPAGRARPRGARAGGPKQAGRNIVTQLLELPVLGQMASCGVDRNIMIWDIFSFQRKKILRGTEKGHEMGVKCMAFSPSTKFLVTGGYDYNLFVWNPYVGKSIFIMRGHLAPIIGVEVIGYNQVVSADADGYMRTWDLGTFQCIQVIEILSRAQVEEGRGLRAFVSVPSQRQVLAVDRKFIAYEYQNTGKADQTDEAPILKAFYHPRLKVFVTGCATHVRIWDAVTGAIKCEIAQLEADSIENFSLDERGRGADIVDFCLDDRGRKIFVADSRGNVSVHSSETGCFIKRLTPHRKEISGMVYCPGDKNLITVSWDRSIMVHDESEQAPNVWRQATSIHEGDVSCMAYSQHLGLIATGSSDCVIAVRDYARLRGHAYLLGHKCHVNCLAFVEPFSLLASADVGGNVAIWAVPELGTSQNTCVTQVLTRFVNMQTLESSASVQCLCPVYEAEPQKLALYTGDEDGDVRVWDLSQLLEDAKLTPAAARAAGMDHRRKDQIDASQNTAAMARKAVSPDVPELQIGISRPVVRQETSWKAHNDSVRSLEVYHRPACVVSAGVDHMVKIWSLEGKPMTALRAYSTTPWSFPVRADQTGIDDETLDRVMARVKSLEGMNKRSPNLVNGAVATTRRGRAAAP